MAGGLLLSVPANHNGVQYIFRQKPAVQYGRQQENMV